MNTQHTQIISAVQKVLLLFSSSLVDCPNLMKPPNGSIDIPSLTQGSTATYTCDKGYELKGNSTRTCDSTAMWTGNEPMCQRK